ncbi:M23 family metallopeptidase [Rhizobium halophytocola]|uniref:Murein DD-endopeptidase MepM/ murein hydrolase activator NlpD n=1 Tax=Rhizobium halophytocola TaxID=735519 RepID=A0ABS4E282_9HYPH|nr:M23 family metallopeptidase [Rhizobium halophytocola]MBP1852048.1 murein DD-endopeptidase MepM/ murein hydrolase activator NlpD [Rhizobium halophytocola]
MIKSLGDDAPILADGRRAPDRREISLRWLSGTFLTGVTSCALMGVALFAALDGRQQLAIPAEAYALARDDSNPGDDDVTRGSRVAAPKIAARAVDKVIMEVPTVIREGEREVVRRQPFSHVKMMLAAAYSVQERYPPFDPLTIFAAGDGADVPVERAGAIYDSDVESEVSLKTIPFPTSHNALPFAGSMTYDEVEENVRSNGSVLTSGDTQVSALYYIDPQRFADDDGDIDITPNGLSARVIEQNMSVSTAEMPDPTKPEYADDIIPVRRPQTISAAMSASGYDKEGATDVENALNEKLGSKDLSPGDVLRIGILQAGDMAQIVRISLYRHQRHILTLAVNDRHKLVIGDEPPMLDAIASAFDADTPTISASRDLPDVYDGIYRAALSYGMTKEMTALVIKLLAANVDFQASLKPTDTLEAFFSVAGEDGKATQDSELLYVRARFGDTVTTFYRYQNPDDNTVDYFDENGKSIRQFLLRSPVPGARLTSGFGMRRHPILGYARMHTGTDWAAPIGTPIICSGDGVVEKAGWSNGYGNQIIVKHANGYESSYNHQSAFAKGIRAGVKVRQGQVIGFVGSTGGSTGPHLHYELIVNGTKVDAMKVRLPGGKSLKGTALARFEDERKRIDTLLHKQPSDEVASSN